MVIAFENIFLDQTLRIDLAHRGDNRKEHFRVTQIVREGAWAGSRLRLRDPFDYGMYRYEIHDLRSGVLVYSRGYSSLFGEWRQRGCRIYKYRLP